MKRIADARWERMEKVTKCVRLEEAEERRKGKKKKKKCKKKCKKKKNVKGRERMRNKWVTGIVK